MEFSPAVRQSNIAQMQAELLDMIIVGGGITGAGIARDAALRGLSTALVEKEDFASGTSSKSARMVHGGLRYLVLFQFGLVFSACAERYKLHKLAPRLVWPLAFTFPVYRHSKNSLLEVRMAMWLYDLIALFRNFRRHKIVNAEGTSEHEPGLARQGLVGSAHYYDCMADDARLTLATIKSAHQHGALIANHAEVHNLIKANGQVGGTKVIDHISGEQFTVRARITVNATGVWADHIRRMDDSGAETMIWVNRGSHLVLPRAKLNINGAVAFSSADGERAMYAIPWGNTSIVGTSDVDHWGDPDSVYATAAEVGFMLDAVNAAFPNAQVTQQDIISTFAGLRPLIGGEEPTAYQASRDHQIMESGSGLLTIAGGKLTTYRRMAEDLVDLAAKKLETQFGVIIDEGCMTARLPLAEDTFDLDSEVDRVVHQHQLDRDVGTHLASTYGSVASTLLASTGQDARMRGTIVPGLPYIWAQVPYAVQQEMALTLSDFMIRRTHIIHEAGDQGLDCAMEVAATMAPYLGWDSDEIERQVQDYREQVELSRRFEQESTDDR
jgi:glycerol-3-phosphate dehydrogenase